VVGIELADHPRILVDAAADDIARIVKKFEFADVRIPSLAMTLEAVFHQSPVEKGTRRTT
jgi:hypothetical protein